MGDEDKSIEAIIAELEILEAKKKEKALEEKTDEGEKEAIFAGSTVEKSSEEPSLEAPREEMFTEATVDKLEKEPLEDANIDNPLEEHTVDPQYETEAQEQVMGIFPKEVAEDQPDEPDTPLEAFPGRDFSPEPSIQMPMEKPHEEMFTEATLDMPEVAPPEDEKIEQSQEEPKVEPKYEPTGQEPGMGIFPEEFAKEQPDEPATPLEPLTTEEFPQDGPIQDDTDILKAEEPFEESRQEPSTDPVDYEDQPGDEPTEDGGDEPPSLPPESWGLRSSRLVLLLVLLLAGLVAYAYFVWPTMYKYSSISSAGKKYEARVNRITGDQQYYDGGVWHSGRIMTPATQVAKPETLTVLEKEKQPSVGKATADEPPGVAEKTLLETPDQERSAAPESVQESIPSEAGEVSVASQPASEKKSEETETLKADEAQPSAAEDKAPIKEDKYVIQLGSMKFMEFAEALVTKLVRQGFDAHMHSFKGEKTGIWHVVYVGRFSSRREAAEFLEKHDLKKIYPGSFVRAVSLTPVEAKK
ncbi:MAG: SPOR domain-containing protein [Deltaproteobacteria bacterium]|nr:SPOR domain-containing protein [Deltaproteobacteria bacterium]